MMTRSRVVSLCDGVQGWFMPAEAAVQLQQCALQQVKPEIRSPSPEDKKKRKMVTGEAAAALLQLPGLEEDTVRQLGSSNIKRIEVCFLALASSGCLAHAHLLWGCRQLGPATSGAAFADHQFRFLWRTRMAVDRVCADRIAVG